MGSSNTGFALRPELKIIEGRKFRPGLREIIVGQAASKQFDGLRSGAELRFRGQTWKIVGIFSLPATPMNPNCGPIPKRHKVLLVAPGFHRYW